jgi:hypothetical protein
MISRLKLSTSWMQANFSYVLMVFVLLRSTDLAKVLGLTSRLLSRGHFTQIAYYYFFRTHRDE